MDSRQDRVQVLGVQIDNVTMDEVVDRIHQAIKDKKPWQVNTLNAEILYQAQSDVALMQAILRSHMVTPDGTGVVWAARYLGQPLKERVTGIDLLTRLLALSPQRDYRLFFYGAKPTVLVKALNNLKASYPGLSIVGSCHGYITEDEQPSLLQAIRKAKPDLLFVALGAPRQELWIEKNLPLLPPLVAIGVGGSLDVLSGELKRAPQCIQSLRLEWLYRALVQPSRLGRLLVLPRFIFRVIASKSRDSIS